MNLSMTGALAEAYKSGCQSARVVTETWGADNFYCPNCTAPKLKWLTAGTEVIDYRCPNCESEYQLKSQRGRIGNSITDGAYGAMMRKVESDETPNFYFLQYDYQSWTVSNLLLVPHFAFPRSAIIKRPPLAATARRAGWIGCNIALNHIPADARISIVTESKVISPVEVRAQFRKIKPLKDISVKERGWTLDVLNGIRTLGKKEFTNTDAYTLTKQLEKLHPDNRHVRDKIRQQLQVLRDAGLLIHVGSALWRLR